MPMVSSALIHSQKEEWIFRAHKLYDAALKLDNRCIYAANGIGIILAERGQLHDAYTVFSQVSILGSHPIRHVCEITSAHISRWNRPPAIRR